jgi:colanic acid/amylovoran biosynthesis protein
LLRAAVPGISLRIYDSNPEGASLVLPGEDVRRIFFMRFLNPGGLLSRPISWIRTKRVETAVYLLLKGLTRIGYLLLQQQERDYLEEFSQADLVISTGGTYLVPVYPMGPRLLELELAAASKTPFVLFTQSLGPFPKRIRRRAARVLSRAERIMVRDARSLQNLREIGISPTMCSVHPDVVFALAGKRGKRPPAVGTRVAISVRQWALEPSAWKRYLDGIAAAVEEIVRGHAGSVTFVSTCQGLKDYWTDDSDVAEQIIELLPEQIKSGVSLLQHRLNPKELLDVYAEHHAVIATRMHAGILALCGGTPVLPIAYEFKTEELFKQLGLEEWVVGMDEIDPEKFPAMVTRFLSQAETFTNRLAPQISEMRSEALASVQPLLELLKRPGRRPD